ncbi:hypothetical protein CF328_g7155, partial [Tilletia controversa]
TRNEDGNAAAPDQEDAFEYEPAGPVPSTSTPEKRPSTSAPSVPVAGPSTPSSSNASRGAHQGRGRGRGASHGNRTHYQQAFLTPQGGVSRNPPPGSGPSTPKRNHKRPRSNDHLDTPAASFVPFSYNPPLAPQTSIGTAHNDTAITTNNNKTQNSLPTTTQLVSLPRSSPSRLALFILIVPRAYHNASINLFTSRTTFPVWFAHVWIRLQLPLPRLLSISTPWSLNSTRLLSPPQPLDHAPRPLVLLSSLPLDQIYATSCSSSPSLAQDSTLTLPSVRSSPLSHTALGSHFSFGPLLCPLSPASFIIIIVALQFPVFCALLLLHPSPSLIFYLLSPSHCLSFRSSASPESNFITIFFLLRGTPTRIPWCFPAAAIAPSETVDLFRLLRPDDVSWTYARTVTRADGTSHTSARRLDSIWGSPALLPLVYSTTVLSTSSDHRAVGVSFLLTGCNTDPSQSSPPLESHLYASRRPWSLHPGLWDNPNFLPALEAFARCYNPPVDPSILSPSTSWNLFHISLLAFLQPLARSIGQEQLAARHDLVTAQRDLDQLNIREPDAARRLPSLLLRWRSALGATQSSENLRPGGHTTAAALRAGSWLFSTFASAASRSFPPLRVTGGFARTSSAKLAALSDFYSSLFSARPAPSLPDSSLLLRSIQLRLDEPATRALNTPFSLEEVFHALRSANRHSSAGPDGITYRVYLATFSAAGPRLQDLANFLGSSPIWPVSARTILLPKAGDPSDIANYRPITITNACVRVISRLVSSRLLRFGSQLLPWTQAAFLPGRRSALVAGVIHGLSDLLLLPPSPLTPPAFFIISLDQRKAYDRVLRTWLFAVLRTVNFPPLLLGVLKALYSQPSTRISALGSMGPVIDLLCGVLQGDPSSCFLYNLSLQPLFDLLLTLGIGVDIPHLGLLSALAFADDCLLFVEASSRGLTQLATLFSCLGSYSAAAGAALNLGKSSFWLLGTPSATNRPFADQISSALSAYGLAHAGSAGPSSHLGHPLPSADASSPHPHTLLFSRLSSIKVRGACFRTMGVDVLSRVTNTNKYLGARLWHTIAVGPLPYSFASLYFDAVNSYIQGASSVLLSQSFLTRPISHGGLNLIDPDAMASALSVSFLRRYLLEPDQIGGWLRAGLTTYLAYRHGVPPAVLLIRTGKAFGRLRHWSTRNDGFLGRLTHALAHVDLGIHESPQYPWAGVPSSNLTPWALQRVGLLR